MNGLMCQCSECDVENPSPPDPERILKPGERAAWILSYLAKRQALYGNTCRFTVDVLTTDFVHAYCDATHARSTVLFLGAPKCPMLGDDLGGLARKGLLERYRTGLSGMESGFPKWVWLYHLPKETK